MRSYAVAEPVGETLDGCPPPGVPPDQIPSLRALRGERALDDLRHLVRRLAPPRGGRRGLPEGSEPLAVERGHIRRQLGREPLEPFGALAPDRRRNRSGLDDHNLDAERLQLDPQRVRHRLERVLGRCIGAEKRERAAPGDRADVHDAAASGPQVGQERLRDRDLADQVHLELMAQLLQRQELERHRDCDPGVVDEALQRAFAELSTAAAIDAGSVTSSVTGSMPPADRAQALGVGRERTPDEHVPARAGEPQRARLSDP
jgi:hypothetical protein